MGSLNLGLQEGGVVENVPQVNRLTFLVRDLDADYGLARYRGYPYARRA